LSDVPSHARPDLELVVPEGPARRLDLFLTLTLEGCSRRQARELIDAGAVRVNGRRACKGQPVFSRDVVHVAVDAREPVALAAQPDLPVRILYEDESVVAVDKPPGMPTHARRLHERGTVANFLVGRYPETRSASPNPLEAGLVHRLDTDTSGVMLAARTRVAYDALRRQFRERAVRKDYLALVAGDVAQSGTVNAPIAHRPRHARRMRACPDPESAQFLKARQAVTRYRPVTRLASATLLAVRIRTGVRHQIRVHLAWIGHPVLGDSLYAKRSGPVLSPVRLFLHAYRVRLQHPDHSGPLIVKAPVPEDFQSVLDTLARGTET